MEYGNILKAMVYGLFFRCSDECEKQFPSDIDFFDNFDKKGLGHILQAVCMFDNDKDFNMIRKINNLYCDLN
jgi:hypothetical protein